MMNRLTHEIPDTPHEKRGGIPRKFFGDIRSESHNRTEMGP